MNKSMKSLVAASVLAAVMGSGAAMAGASANVGATSNYVWRGITQSQDGAAVSGGLDYSHDSGELWQDNSGELFRGGYKRVSSFAKRD